MNRPPSSWKCPAIVRAVRVPTLQGSFGFWPLHALEATSGIRLKLTLTRIVRWISHGMGAHNPLDGSALLFFDSTRRGRHRRATRTVPRAINTHSEQGMSSFVITSIIFKTQHCLSCVLVHIDTGSPSFSHQFKSRPATKSMRCRGAAIHINLLLQIWVDPCHFSLVPFFFDPRGPSLSIAVSSSCSRRTKARPR